MNRTVLVMTRLRCMRYYQGRCGLEQSSAFCARIHQHWMFKRHLKIFFFADIFVISFFLLFYAS